MSINNVNNVDHSSSVKSTGGSKKSQSVKTHNTQKLKADAVEVKSPNNTADKIAFRNAMSIIEKTSDVRESRITELKNNPDLFTKPSSEILESVAKKLLKDFLG